MDKEVEKIVPQDRSQKDQAFLERLHGIKPLPFEELARGLGYAPPAEENRGRLSSLMRSVPTDGTAQVKRLEAEGAIVGYRAVVDARRMAEGQISFVHVLMRDISRETRDAFATAVQALPEIEACHMITGDYHYLLRVRTADVKEFRGVLSNRIAAMPGVARMTANVAMETVKNG